jgi:ADP-heptose:LPS heptosyltransferase
MKGKGRATARRKRIGPLGAPLRQQIKFATARGVARLFRRPALDKALLLALEPASILLVRQHNQMGDMVCATPALRAVRETWPAARITLVTSPVNGAVVGHNPHVDRVLTFDKRAWKNPVRMAGFLGELRSVRADLAFVLASVSFSVTSAGLALASGARWVVGPDTRPFGRDLSRHLFSLEMPGMPVVDRHAVAHSLAPLQAVGITTDDLSTVVRPASAERALADAVLDDLGLAPGFWALHPGAGKAQNVWPADRFAAVARAVLVAGHRLLVLHGPADGPALDALRRELGPDSGVCVAPDLPVGALAAVLARADRFLANDTGVMHVAGAVGTPTLALFGPTDPALWKPPGDHVEVVVSPGRREDERGPDFGWMESIEVPVVLERWTTMAGRAAGAEA